VIKSPGLAGIYEKPANLGFFLFLRVLVANQRGEVYLSDWIFDYNNGTSIPLNSDRTECVYDSHKDSIAFWLINHEKNFKPLGQATDMTK
jgi:hypothetical protein